MNSKRLLLPALVLILWGILGSLTATAAPDPSLSAQPPETECNPVARRLAQSMGVDCSVLVDYQARGVGFGVIRQAYALSQSVDGASWQALVDMQMNEAGPGWGEIKKAYRLANQLGVDPQALLAQLAQGLGWGEILQEYRQGPGKPPWANGPKTEKKAPGKPPWAGGPKLEKEGFGKPPWASEGPPPWARPGRARTAARRGAKR